MEFAIFLCVYFLLAFASVFYAEKYDNAYADAVIDGPSSTNVFVRACCFAIFAPTWYVPRVVWVIGEAIFWEVSVIILAAGLLLSALWMDTFMPEESKRLCDAIDELKNL